MNALALGLGLAVLASLTLNGAFLLQHAGSRDAPDITLRRPLASIRGLLGSRLWLAGLVAGLAGWALHVGALSRAPLSLVQAFSGGGIALAAPVASRTLAERLTGAERTGMLVTVLALGTLAIGSHPGNARVPGVLGFAFFVAATTGLAAALVAAPAGGPRPHLLGLAGGVFYGVADAATKGVTAQARTGLLAAVASPWLVVAVAATAAAFLAFQRGLQKGPALPVIALMTAGTNAVAIVAGLTIFGDPLGSSAALTLAHAFAFGLVGLGAWLLAPAQAGMAAGRRTSGPRRGAAFERGPRLGPLLRRTLAAAGGWTVTALSVVAGLGLLYLVRSASVLGAGPRVAGALPLEKLAHADAQPLLRMAAAWLPAGVVAGLGLRRLGRLSRGISAAVAGATAAVLLTLSAAGSDAVENSESVAPHLLGELGAPALAVAVTFLVVGAYAGARMVP
jgi:hypothetical protein